MVKPDVRQLTPVDIFSIFSQLPPDTSLSFNNLQQKLRPSDVVISARVTSDQLRQATCLMLTGFYEFHTRVLTPKAQQDIPSAVVASMQMADKFILAPPNIPDRLDPDLCWGLEFANLARGLQQTRHQVTGDEIQSDHPGAIAGTWYFMQRARNAARVIRGDEHAESLYPFLYRVFPPRAEDSQLRVKGRGRRRGRDSRGKTPSRPDIPLTQVEPMTLEQATIASTEGPDGNRQYRLRPGQESITVVIVDGDQKFRDKLNPRYREGLGRFAGAFAGSIDQGRIPWRTRNVVAELSGFDGTGVQLGQVHGSHPRYMTGKPKWGLLPRFSPRVLQQIAESSAAEIRVVIDNPAWLAFRDGLEEDRKGDSLEPYQVIIETSEVIDPPPDEPSNDADGSDTGAADDIGSSAEEQSDDIDWTRINFDNLPQAEWPLDRLQALSRLLESPLVETERVIDPRPKGSKRPALHFNQFPGLYGQQPNAAIKLLDAIGLGYNSEVLIRILAQNYSPQTSTLASVFVEIEKRWKRNPKFQQELEKVKERIYRAIHKADRKDEAKRYAEDDMTKCLRALNSRITEEQQQPKN